MARSRRRSTKNQPLRPWQLLLLVLIGGAIYLYNEGYFDRYLKDFLKDPTSTPPVAQGNGEAPAIQLSKAVGFSGLWYQVYFTRPDYPEKAEGRSGGIEDAMIADINAAKSSVRLAVYEFDRTPVADALIAAKQRGLTVEMVFDAENLDDPEMATEIGRIEQAGIPITYENSEAFMHNKILLLDDTVLWTGSMNLTRNDVYRNNNNMIRTSLAPLVENYRVRFADLFAGRFGSKSRDNTPNHEIDLDGGVKIENYFSPSDGARAYMLGYLKNAQSSIKVLAFSFTDDATAQELIALHGRGGDVRVVMETRNADGTGSEFGTLEQAGISVLRDANCYTAHNKIIVIDERVVVTGSYNFTARAEDTNDENMLIISDPTLAKYYSDEFERLYAQAQAGSRCGN
jgi:phosphatidylserine/phosphatidylglycerophosphate/cardiolipin synthase-like enzyme